MIEAVLQQLDVEIANVGEKEIKCFCPVHEMVKGRPDSHPSFYINAVTGAWLCFSCQSSGSLPSLVEALNGDFDGVGEVLLAASESTLERLASRYEDDEPEPAKERPYVSERLFNKNPRPPERMLARRKIDSYIAERFNIRWSPERLCFLLPVYDFNGVLLGWQEKSRGHFNNFPADMEKRHSLFGWQCLTGKNTNLVIVESPLDAARFVNIRQSAVAIYGSFISDEQIEAIDRYQPTMITIAYDDDDAGHKAADITYRRLKDLGTQSIAFFRYPQGKYKEPDPGDLTEEELIDGILYAVPSRLLASLPPVRRRKLKIKA